MNAAWYYSCANDPLATLFTYNAAMNGPATPATTPGRLAFRLGLYFFMFFASIVFVSQFMPEALKYLPFGGRDALESMARDATSAKDIIQSLSGSEPNVIESSELKSVETIILFVVGHLTGTILLMLPITWTYSATHWDVGFSRSFVRALMVLPLCATTVVLLIQDSLALAFGLAALVAAVRFRVSLDEAMDGIYIFAAVCVGLAAGIGYLGVAAVMSLFFCFASVFMWATAYGENPVDNQRRAKKHAKLSSDTAADSKAARM